MSAYQGFFRVASTLGTDNRNRIEAYRQHFKEKYDLDALREAAFGRYLIGPLKLPTLSRLSDRLVKQFREKLTKPGS